MNEKLTDYEQPSVTTDIVIFTIMDKDLKVLLVKRAQDPFKGKWALPGGFVRINESIDGAAKRELHEETGVKSDYLEQLYTFGEVERDPRGRVITIAYFALIKPRKVKGATDVSEAEWFSVYDYPELCFDHKKILEYALKRLRWKFEYTTVAFSLLPKKFTLTRLQRIYEIVFNKEFDKRNFRKKLLALDVVKPTGEIKQNVSYRPPEYYALNKKIGEVIEMI